jgi:hypothetical protein
MRHVKRTREQRRAAESREDGMSDEKSKFRNETDTEEGDVVAHKFLTEEPAEDEPGKMKMKYKFKMKRSDEVGGDDSETRGKY